MSLKLNYGTGVCSIPSAALNLKDAERIELLVLLHASENPDCLGNISALAKKLGCTEKKVASAIDFWLENGILVYDGTSEDSIISDDTYKNENCVCNDEIKAATQKSEKSRFESRPSYDSAELASLIEENSGALGRLVEECQTITEHIFSPTEIGKIASMRDYLGLEAEHILMLFTYLSEKGKKSVSYIEKTAYNLFDEGITDVDKLNAYIMQKEQNESKERELVALIGGNGRSLLKKEKDAFAKWLDDWKLDRSLIKAAYEETVLNIGKYNFAYMSKVLENWYTAGYKTDTDITLAKEKQEDSPDSAQVGSFNQDEFLALALKRSKAEMDS